LAIKKKTILLDETDDFFIVKSAKEKILDEVPRNKKTNATLVSNSVGITTRKALAYLTELEEKGYFESEFKMVKYKSGAITKCRIFKRL
jgi:predicted ArsR family transcriptional regulator